MSTHTPKRLQDLPKELINATVRHLSWRDMAHVYEALRFCHCCPRDLALVSNLLQSDVKAHLLEGQDRCLEAIDDPRIYRVSKWAHVCCVTFPPQQVDLHQLHPTVPLTVYVFPYEEVWNLEPLSECRQSMAIRLPIHQLPGLETLSPDCRIDLLSIVRDEGVEIPAVPILSQPFRCRHLATLSIDVGDVDYPVPFIWFNETFAMEKGLSQVHVQNVTITTKEEVDLLKGWVSPANTKKLNLLTHAPLHTDMAHVLGWIGPGLVTLTLNLEGTIQSVIMDAVCSMLQQGPLQDLTLSCYSRGENGDTTLTPTDTIRVMTLLPQSKIRHLCLGWVPMDFTRADSLLRDILQKPGLSSLKLMGCQLNDHFSMAWQALPRTRLHSLILVRDETLPVSQARLAVDQIQATPTLQRVLLPEHWDTPWVTEALSSLQPQEGALVKEYGKDEHDDE